MKEYELVKVFLAAHWLTLVAVLILVCSVFVLWHSCVYFRRFVGVIWRRFCAGYRLHIMGCLTALIFLFAMPIWVPKSYSAYFDNIMRDNTNYTVTKNLKIEKGFEDIVRLIDKKNEGKSDELCLTVLKIETSRAPAIFLLIFTCFMYVFTCGIVIVALVKTIRSSKRESLMQEYNDRIEKILNELDDEKISETRKLYLKKILDGFIAICIDDQDDKW